MTYLEQQVALCKWAYPGPLFQYKIEGSRLVCEAHHDDGRVVLCQTPNCGSLDELHEMEENLTDEQKKVYVAHLHPKELHHYLLSDFLVAHASAPRRREALLRTLGLWVNPPPSQSTPDQEA